MHSIIGFTNRCRSLRHRSHHHCHRHRFITKMPVGIALHTHISNFLLFFFLNHAHCFKATIEKEKQEEEQNDDEKKTQERYIHQILFTTCAYNLNKYM